MNVVGRWSQPLPAHFDEGELRSREGCQGTGNVRVRAAIGLEPCHDNVKETVFKQRNPYGLRNCNDRNTARAGRDKTRPAARAVLQPELTPQQPA